MSNCEIVLFLKMTKLEASWSVVLKPAGDFKLRVKMYMVVLRGYIMYSFVFLNEQFCF